MGISGSGPPPLYAHYNLLLPTVPHDNPPARPLRFSIGIIQCLTYPTQLKILGGAPEEYRGERWATGDYSGRIGEEAHSPICPLKLPDKIITGDLWWELLRGPQWSHRRLEGAIFGGSR